VALTSYLEVARFVGLDPYAMLREVGISPTFLENPENRCAAAAVTDLLENSARRSGCETFGLLMAECRTFASLGPVSLLLQHLPTVGDVVSAIIDMRRHFNDVNDFTLEVRGDVAVFRAELLAPYATPQAFQILVAMMYIVLRGASSGRWQATSIHFIGEAPRDLSAVQRLFPVPVEYESNFNGITMPSAALAIRNPLASEALAAHARELLSLVPVQPEHHATSDRTRRAITLLLPSGRATLDNVARNLRLAPRTLQRNLEREQISFAVLLNEVRKELAQRYLIDFARPVDAVADLTGYSSASAFGRWFAAEFGASPAVWRKAQAESQHQPAALPPRRPSHPGGDRSGIRRGAVAPTADL
jgi:AraC-like DNA-binding protein